MTSKIKNKVLLLGLAVACLLLIGAPEVPPHPDGPDRPHPNLPSLPKPIPLEYPEQSKEYSAAACSQFTGKCDKIPAAKQTELRDLLSDPVLQRILKELDSDDHAVREKASEDLKEYIKNLATEKQEEMITALGCFVGRNSTASAEVKQRVLVAITRTLGCGFPLPICKGPPGILEQQDLHELYIGCDRIAVDILDATYDYFYGPSCERVGKSIDKVVEDYFAPIYRGCTTFQPVLVQPESPNACLEVVDDHCAFRAKAVPFFFVFMHDPIDDQVSCAATRCKASGGVLEECSRWSFPDEPVAVPSLSDEPEADETRIPSERELLWDFYTFPPNKCVGGARYPIGQLCCFKDPERAPAKDDKNYWRPPYALEGEREFLINGKGEGGGDVIIGPVDPALPLAPEAP